jgi:mannose-6-phosphate isomerase-like protein (cupin superfamily)
MTHTTFSHQKANSPEARYTDGGLRSFFVYRDTGVTAATNGKVRVQLVRAAYKSSEAKGGTGFHFHTADVHVVYMVRGWAKFDYDGVNTLVEAGDCVHQRRASSTVSTTGRTTWNSWRSSCRGISSPPKSRRRRRSQMRPLR